MAKNKSMLDVELEDLPSELRWREWMSRVEAVIFASASPVSREDLTRVVGQGASVELLIADIQAGPVAELCRSFNRILCAKGERLWERNTQ